jgi:hypothetical protein
MIAARALLLAALAALPLLGQAQVRPSEEDLFGAPAEPPKDARPVEPPAAEKRPPATTPGGPMGGDARGDALLGESSAHASGVISGDREDWLRLGGLAYQRAFTTWTRGDMPSAWRLSDPSLLDLYLDARPNDRVRAYALGRLTHTPSGSGPSLAGLSGLPGPGTTSTGPTTRAVLDQLWINFDADRIVFITAGKQHVKWGTGRFWNPTDYLHPTRRDPLTLYDERSGVTMVKAHLPWEKRGWNFYGIAMLEDLAGGTQPDGSVKTVSTVGDVGAGGRAEAVIGGLELAVDGMVQRGHRPRFGVDGSFPIGDFDLKFEVALRRGRDVPRWEEVDPTRSSPLDRFRLKQFDGLTPAAVVGAEWSWKYSDQDSLTIGGEYAYDASGYGSARIYPYLLVLPYLGGDQRTAFTPFYLAKQYAGLYLYLPAPGSWNDTTITLSALGSITDGSALIRLDHSVVINTYLRLETFVAGHVGHQFGEFRFGGTIPKDTGGTGLPPVDVAVPVPVVDLGVALRVSL